MDKIRFSKRPNYRLYSEELKKAVVKEYLKTNCSKEYLARKYGLGGRNTVSSWLKKYGENQELCTLENKVKLPSIMSDQKPLPADKEKRIQQLEEELRDAKLLLEAYKRMIDIAEKEYQISIKKKQGTKQSTNSKR